MRKLELKIPPAIVFLICLMGVWAINKYLDFPWLMVHLPKGLAYALTGLGLLIGLIGVADFVRAKTTINPHKPENTTGLVDSGLYSFSRNPMYLAMLLVLIAGILKWGNLFGLLMVPVYIWYLNEFQIKPEEEVLIEKFGDEYAAYREKVRRWI